MSTIVVTIALVLALATLPVRATATPDLAGEIQALRERPSFQLRSLVPGLVQLDRGEKVKGWILIGCEAALLTAALQMQLRAVDLRGQAAAQAGAGPDAWAASQKLGFDSAQRVRFRDGFLVAAAAVWALSLVDAHLSPAAQQSDAPALSDRPLMPIASISRRGLVAGLSLKF